MRKLFRKILQILDGAPTTSGNHQRGQSTLELAFITPLLIMLIVGIVEIGWYANNYLALLEVTRVGARRGTLLIGDNGPLAWNNAASIMFGKGWQAAGLSPGDLAAVENTSWNFRNACVSLQETDFGFYNLIVCQMLSSMDPLSLRLNDLDDIVVSAFALQTVNNANPLDYDPIDDSGIYRRTYNFAEFDIGIPPGEFKLPEDFSVVVVARYPSNANECTVAAVSPPPVEPPTGTDTDGDGVTDDLDACDSDVGPAANYGCPYTEAAIERDPFNYITDDNHPTVGLAENGTLLNFELTGYDVGLEHQRGFAWFGQHRVNNSSVQCWGSEFELAEVEEVMNLPGFTLVGAGYDNRNYLTPGMGMVLVEIFWEHSTLLHFPLIDVSVIESLNPVVGSLGTRPVISLWAAFPAPAAEPSPLIKFQAVD